MEHMITDHKDYCERCTCETTGRMKLGDFENCHGWVFTLCKTCMKEIAKEQHEPITKENVTGESDCCGECNNEKELMKIEIPYGCEFSLCNVCLDKFKKLSKVKSRTL